MLRIGHYLLDENDYGWAVLDEDGMIVVECQTFDDAARIARKLLTAASTRTILPVNPVVVTGPDGDKNE